MRQEYKILVVEDDEIWQKKFVVILEDEGCFVQIASDHQEAKSALEEQAFHLAVVDLSLIPGDQMDRAGLQLLDEISKYEGMAAVVVTAFGTLEEASEWARKRKAFRFIGKKDFDSEKFRELVKEAIEDAITRKEYWDERKREAERAEARRRWAREREWD